MSKGSRFEVHGHRQEEENEVMCKLRTGSTQLRRGGGQDVALREKRSRKHTHHQSAGHRGQQQRWTEGNNRWRQRVEDMRKKGKRHKKR